MRECVRMIRAESYKMRGTLFLPFHMMVPCVGGLLFLFYYGYHDFAPGKEWAWYIETVSIVFPAMISFVCSISVRIEKNNHFSVLLGTAVCRRNSLLAKWIVLSAAGLFSLIIAVGGFFAVWRATEEKGDGFGRLCLLTILILWAGSQSMYLFHLCVCLRWSENISMCIGVLQSVLAALLQTGLGHGIWQFFGCSFCGRWSSYLLLYCYVYGEGEFKLSFGSGIIDGLFAFGKVPENLAVSAGVMVIWIIGIFVWYQRFEGRCMDD